MRKHTLQNIISCTLGGKNKVLKHGVQCIMLDNQSSCSQMSVCVCVCVCKHSCVQLVATPWTVACQNAMSMEFPRQEYQSRLSFPTPGDLPNPGIKPTPLVSPAFTGIFFNTEPLYRRASLVAQLVKNLLAIQETPVQFLGQQDPQEKGQATRSSILAWRIPMGRRAWQTTVHGVVKSWTGLRGQVQHSTIQKVLNQQIYEDMSQFLKFIKKLKLQSGDILEITRMK